MFAPPVFLIFGPPSAIFKFYATILDATFLGTSQFVELSYSIINAPPNEFLKVLIKLQKNYGLTNLHFRVSIMSFC